LLKNGHLLRFPHPLSLGRTAKYASLLRISGAPVKRDFATLNLHLTLFELPGKVDFFSSLSDYLTKDYVTTSKVAALNLWEASHLSFVRPLPGKPPNIPDCLSPRRLISTQSLHRGES
jgi:hypothetical protein